MYLGTTIFIYTSMEWEGQVLANLVAVGSWGRVYTTATFKDYTGIMLVISKVSTVPRYIQLALVLVRSSAFP